MRISSMPLCRGAVTAAAVAMLVTPNLLMAQEDSSETNNRRGLSLDPERTIAFETTEGTYMNLDVSPDGRTIVFDLLGDLYTIPVAGGAATRLTSGMASDVQPTFSPDGRTVAFISDESGSDNIWTIGVDGAGRTQVTEERERAVSTPEWTPEGDYILARRAREMWLYHIDGGKGMKLTSADGTAGATGLRMSPDGRTVYFANRAGGGGGLGGIISWQVFALDRLTGDVAAITASPNGAFRPTVSPDGMWMAYGVRLDAKTGLRLRNLETFEERWLAYDIDRDNAERAGMLDLMPRYDFTPDGAALILATGGTFHRIDLASGDDEALAFSASVEQELGPFVYFEDHYTNDDVVIKNMRYANRGADGERVVFAALNRIWAVEREGDRPRPLVEQDGGQFQPVLSPDGRSVAYVTWDDVGGGHVWVVDVSGGEPRRLTEHAAFYVHPAWSPDGSRIAFLQEDAAAPRNVWSRNTGRLLSVPAAGGEVQYVTSAPTDNRLSFNTDGTRVTYLAESRGGNPFGGNPARSELVSVRLDGTDKRTVATFSAETYEAVPSPDGRWVAFAVREDLYLAALPMAADPPQIGETSGPGPVKRITREGGIDLHWDRGGETLSWVFGNTLYSIGLDEAWEESAGEDDPAPQPSEFVMNLSAPRHYPRGSVALRGGNVITMRGDEVLENATIVVTDNRITEVGRAGDVTIPADATVIDVTGKTLMPGFVDIHAHLRPPREVFVETSWSYLANLAYGVTTTRDVSTSNDSFAYAELVETGTAMGPRIYSTGRAMTTGNAKIENLEDARAIVRHYKRLGTNVIKQYMQPHRRQRQWVIQAAREENMNVTNEGGGDFRLNMTMIADGFTGFEHALPIANIYSDVTRFVAESRTWYTPTLVVAYGGPTAEWYFYQTTNVHDDEKLQRFTPHDVIDRRTRRGQMAALDEYHFLAVSKVAAKIHQLGGNIGLGAHGEEQGICAHWELWALQMGGLSNHEALRIATRGGAEGLGLQNELGSIAAGMLADILVLDANPLDDIRNSNTIRYVMKNGELFQGDDLAMVWPERRDVPAFTFRDYGPPPVGGSQER